MAPSQFDALPEDDRELMIAEDELVCPSCGSLKSVCSDPEQGWYPQRDFCSNAATYEATMRKLRLKHKDNEPGKTAHPLDGVSVWMSMQTLTKKDRFLDDGHP